ncbi:MAG: hypothetical protein KGL10_07660 [Alphaproteobacteria bacterium]|nr:hypothetical protein [Alphaproteobacteria bacterium]
MFKGTTAKDIGILLIGVAACIGAFSYKPARFELAQLGTFRADQFLLDKSTGRIWQSVCAGTPEVGECKGMMVWQEMFVGGITPQGSPATSEFQDFISKHQKKSKK